MNDYCILGFHTIPRDTIDIAAMLVSQTKEIIRILLLRVHQHGRHDSRWKPATEFYWLVQKLFTLNNTDYSAQNYQSSSCQRWPKGLPGNQIFGKTKRLLSKEINNRQPRGGLSNTHHLTRVDIAKVGPCQVVKHLEKIHHQRFCEKISSVGKSVALAWIVLIALRSNKKIFFQ